MDNGEYKYFFTAEPPFVPTCFRGMPGSIADALPNGNQACPAKGRCNQPMRALYTFPTVPPLNTADWKAHSTVFGVLFLTVALFSASVIALELRKTFWLGKDRKDHGAPPLIRALTLASVFVAATSRGVFFVVDPYATRDIIPPLLEGLMFTLSFPCLNSALCLVLLTVYELAVSMKNMSRIKGFLPRTKRFLYTFCILEFVTQITADIIRSQGIMSEILVICQVRDIEVLNQPMVSSKVINMTFILHTEIKMIPYLHMDTDRAGCHPFPGLLHWLGSICLLLWRLLQLASVFTRGPGSSGEDEAVVRVRGRRKGRGERDTERQRDRETERETERQTDRQRRAVLYVCVWCVCKLTVCLCAVYRSGDCFACSAKNRTR
jgi:hypothetical protein